MKPTCVLFAGVVGCSKTPVANYVSTLLNLPVFATDPIRSEVIEDTLGALTGQEAENEISKRRGARLQKVLDSKVSFILDASIDRRWPELQEKLEKEEYQWVIISYDLGKEFLKKLHKVKNYNEPTPGWLDGLYADHQKFVANYMNEVSYTVTDENFATRLDDSLNFLSKRLNTGI